MARQQPTQQQRVRAGVERPTPDADRAAERDRVASGAPRCDAREPKDANGNVLSVIQTGQTVDWTSSAPSVARVGQNGKVRGLTLGSTTITAAIEGKSNSAAITVDSLLIVATVHVTPATDSVRVDSTVTLTAWPLDAAGDTLTAAFTIWTSSDTALAKVSNADTAQATLGVAPGNTAQVTGSAAGTVTITAKIAGVSGTGSMKVKP